MPSSLKYCSASSFVQIARSIANLFLRLPHPINLTRQRRAFFIRFRRRQTLLDARVQFHIPHEPSKRAERTHRKPRDAVQKPQLQEVHLEKFPRRMQKETPHVSFAALAVIALRGLRRVAVEA